MAHILVVDDEPAMLQLIRRVLEKDQHFISLVSDAGTVLNMNFSKYDLILLDIMMPGLDRFEICRQIRSRVDCPIIFLTAKIENGRTSDNRYLYSVIDCKEEILILRYHMAAQFRNPTLRNVFPSAEQICIIIL